MADWERAAALLRRLLQGGRGLGSVCDVEHHHLPVLDEVLSEILNHGTTQESERRFMGSSLLQHGEMTSSLKRAAPVESGNMVTSPSGQGSVPLPYHGGGVGLFCRHSVPHRPEHEHQSGHEKLALALLCAYLALVAYNMVYAIQRHASRRASECQSTCRCCIWDAIKFLLMTGVIFFHFAFYLSAEDLTAWTISRAALRPVVPCFILVSGVFGTNVSFKALWKVIFYPWPCVLVIGAIVAARCIDERMQAATAGFNGFAFWYLWCLCFWRLTVSPLLHVGSSKLGLPVIWQLLVLQLLVYVLLNSMGSLGGPWNDVWRCYLFYAPIFAAGQLLTPSFWKDTFAEKQRAAGTTVASVAFLGLWYFLFVASPMFSQWNTAYCISEETCKMGNYGIPNDVLHEPISQASLCENIAMLALRLGIALAYLGTLGASLHGLKALYPDLVSLAAGWGERSLYAYVLHHIWLELVMAAGGQEMLDVAPTSLRPGLCFVLALQATVVLSSEGTESLVRWLLIPPWL